MKKTILISILFIYLNNVSKAQWCLPTTAIPYNTDMPGLTHVVINTIDRTSLDLENGMNNSYVNTGLSTQLIRGTAYDVTLSYTIDANICLDMNLRVWIDFNHDGQLDDVGETVIIANNQLPPTYHGNFTVPANAPLGTTRMRVTAKMTPNGGHTMPTPCDDPADPFGYHGEFEDYDVEIMDATGIESPSTQNNLVIANQAGKYNFTFDVTGQSSTQLRVTDITGKVIEEIIPKQNLSAGKHSYDWNTETQAGGIYFVTLVMNESTITKRILIQ